MNRTLINIDSVISHLKWVGVRGTLRTILAKAAGEKPCVPISGWTPTFHIRTRTSDLCVFGQVLVGEQYRCRSPREVKTIIDAGANIGASAVFFAREFPGAKIVSIEPDVSNLQVLRQNTEPYPNISIVHAALWHHNGMAEVVDTGEGAWALRVMDNATTEGAGQQIATRTLDSILEEYQFAEIDYLKIDIEGAEKALLETSAGVLDRVNILAIECHDRWVPGCTRTLMNATKGFDYEWVQGDNHLFCREGWLPIGQEAAPIAK